MNEKDLEFEGLSLEEIMKEFGSSEELLDSAEETLSAQLEDTGDLLKVIGEIGRMEAPSEETEKAEEVPAQPAEESEPAETVPEKPADRTESAADISSPPPGQCRENQPENPGEKGHPQINPHSCHAVVMPPELQLGVKDFKNHHRSRHRTPGNHSSPAQPAPEHHPEYHSPS